MSAPPAGTCGEHGLTWGRVNKRAPTHLGVDPTIQTLLKAAPFQLTTDGGVEAARQRFRAMPRRDVHTEVRTEDLTIEEHAGPIPLRVYRPPNDVDGP